MSANRHSSHPKPWMEEPTSVTPADLNGIIAPDGIQMLPSRTLDEVYPGIYIGERDAAVNVLMLQNKKFTHVLNTALGKSQFHCNTNHVMYNKVGIQFLGIKADDTTLFNLLPHFQKTSEFIHKALREPNGKILVHCRAGASRSATVVIAYLMMKQDKTVTEATRIVRSKREISPNPGFLKQLCCLQELIDSHEWVGRKKICVIS